MTVIDSDEHTTSPDRNRSRNSWKELQLPLGGENSGIRPICLGMRHAAVKVESRLDN